MGANDLWFKSRKGIMLLVVLVIVVAALVVLYPQSAGIPPDQVEVIVVRHENEPSFNVGPLTEEGGRLLSKCEDVLSNLSGHMVGFFFENEATEVKEEYAYVEIIFKDNYDVPIRARWSEKRGVLSSRVLFVLSGEPPEGYRGSVLFRGVEPSPWDNSFIWNWYGVSSDDQTGWPIFQELIETASEIKGV
jgi:hypothetical protein